ncbi:MAG: M20/M25/M40 family metallo-hydrolase, partial [bacterium]
TTNGGDTWEAIEFASGYPEYQYKPFATCFATPQIGWLGGEYFRQEDALKGFISKTTDGGRNWVAQTIPEDFRIYAMGFFDANYGWAGGRTSDGRLFYTANGGATWLECSVPVGVERFTDVAAVGPTEAWAAVRSNNLLHTTDGLTWAWVNTGAARELYRVEFPDNQHGYAGGYELVATDNGGATWRKITGLPAGVCYALSFADRNRGVVDERYGKYLYRTDNGCASFVSIIDTMDVAAENVIGERRGNAKPDEIVIIGGHFDSTSDMHPSLAPGADDNASGTAVAMAAARALKDITFRRTVRYVTFGDEESGGIGSEAYAEHCAGKGEKIVAVLNADMVAYDEEGGNRDDYAVDYDRYGWLYDYLKATGGLYGNNLIYERGTCGSDHRSFWDVGYAAVGTIEGNVGPGGSSEYPYYHTTEDTLDKLHPALGVRFVRDYAAMFAHLAGISDVGVNDPRPGAVAPFARPFAVYPNPYCYTTSAGGVNFVGIKPPATVEIYDLAGRRVAAWTVATGRDSCVWTPARANGDSLAPGVYLYRVEGQEQKKAGKIVITY